MIEAAILIGLASYRIAHLLVAEDGPFDIIEKFRRSVGLKEGPVVGLLPLMLTCIYCTSVWTTIVAYLIWVIEPTAVMIIASMTIPLIVNSLVER